MLQSNIPKFGSLSVVSICLIRSQFCWKDISYPNDSPALADSSGPSPRCMSWFSWHICVVHWPFYLHAVKAFFYSWQQGGKKKW